MADMEALFAEMRKAQTGGRDFAAEARAAAGASGDSDADSEDTGSEDDASATEHLPPRAMDASRTKACVRVSELGRATAREAKAVARSFAHGDPRDADDPRVPDPALEAARHRAVAGVAAVFESACGKTIGGRWWSHFEAWLYARRSAAASSAAAKAKKGREAKGSEGDGVYTAADAPDDATFDPVIPDPALARSDKALERKLEAAGMGRYEIVGVGMELSKACARAHASVAAARSGKRKPVKMSAPFAVSSGKDSGKETEDKHLSSTERAPAMKVTLTHGKTRLEVNVETLNKLRALHGRLAFPKSARGDERRFLNDAFCVLARYAAAQGAHHKAGTMQASAPGAVFDVLKKTFGVEAELCASPVNCRFRNFGSAFLDVDRHFGSFGSVFAFKPKRGSFQANPPFDSAFIGRLVKRFETLLRDTNEPLSFVLIVPYWPTEACWKNLTSSPFKRKPLLRLKKNKHGYVAGSSATRVKRTTPASFTTDVVFLQNEAGAFKWPVTDTTLRLIKIGFKEGLPNSSRKREAARDDGDDDASMSSSDGGGGSSETDYDSSGDDETKPLRSFGNDGDEVKAALRLSKGKVWDPDEFLFWGVGSAKRWGERPAEWMLDAAGDVLEAHWVGEDPDSEEEDEEEEGEEAEEGDSEEEGEDEDEASESDLELEGEAAGSPDEESDDGEEEEESDEDDEDEDEDDASGSSGDDDDDDDDGASSSEEEESDERARKRRR
jgi:phosphorylated CTD-interacting factor 1